MAIDATALDWRLDSPWRRLPWTLPGALLIVALMVWVLASLMERPAHRLSEPAPIDAQVVELPPPPPPEIRRERPPPPTKPAPKMASPQPMAKPSPSVELQKPPPPAPAPIAPAQMAPVAPPPSPAPPKSVATDSSNLSGNSGAQAIMRPMPQIPDDLRVDALDTSVEVRFHVAVDGSVTVELTKPTPNPRLNHLLLNTFETWRFFPEMRGGKPVESIEKIVVRIEVK